MITERIASPELLAANVCKLLLDLSPSASGTFRYAYATAVRRNLAIIGFATCGIYAIVRILAPNGKMSDIQSGDVLNVLVLFLPQMA